DEMPPSILRSTGQGIEVGKEIGRYPQCCSYMPEQQRCNDCDLPNLATQQPRTEYAGANEENGENGKDVAMSNVQMARDGRRPVDQKKREQRCERIEALERFAAGANSTNHEPNHACGQQQQWNRGFQCKGPKKEARPTRTAIVSIEKPGPLSRIR